MAAAAFLGLPLSRMVILDFGMGWASWARIAQSLGCQSYGSELSANRMAYAARFGVRTLTLKEADGLGAHFINTEQVIEHLAEPRHVIAGLARSLAPGGILKIAVPAPAKAEEALRAGRIAFPDIMPIQPLEHLNCFTEGALARTGREFRLEIVRPSYAARYAFLGQGGLDFRKPKKALKELVRPFYTYRSRSNLVVWLQKQSGNKR